MSSAMAQINVRIDRDLKQRGDMALAEAGISPSEAIRALWNKVAQRGSAVAEVKQLLFENGKDCPTTDEAGLVCQGWKLADEFLDSIGFDSAQESLVDQPWGELYQEAMDEHFARKGVLQ